MCQFTRLRMLVEQGDAEETQNGVRIPSETVVGLDQYTRDLLGLPEVWEGSLHADIRGKSGSGSFGIELTAAEVGGIQTHGFEVIGPVISFSQERQYLLSPASLLIFSALDQHRNSGKSEYDDLSLVYALQEGQRKGASISLGHFRKLNIKVPASITVSAELDEDGRMILTPQMGQDASHERIQEVLGQLVSDSAVSLRVDDEIVLFDKDKLSAVHEVLRNRIIPKNKVNEFISNPTSYIDAGLVDLDVGFSSRVKGATRFRLAYFGETDESGIDWFGKKHAAEKVYSPTCLCDHINDVDQLDTFINELKNARQTSSQVVKFDGKSIDISDTEMVDSVLEDIKTGIIDTVDREYIGSDNDDDYIGLDTQDGDSDGYDDTGLRENCESDPIVVDIDLNDDSLGTPSRVGKLRLEDVLQPEETLDWRNYSRIPYPHQVFGTRWILGLALVVKNTNGGLLADDMGLGKTFMALAAIDHLYKVYRSKKIANKPCLVVAPLSVLQNWSDEVDKTFSKSPFRDVVILQSESRLGDFRVGGNETRNQELIGDETAKIRYSLKIGDMFSDERLDLPRRLVITTYQTLRDYQFSLCSVDWGMVVFDEAQNIKNPNALQTRAAKGVKADFRLLATGTPVENSLADYWCLMDTVCPGYLDSYQNFKNEYILPIMHASSHEIEAVRAKVGTVLRKKVGALMLRRLKEDNLEGLPNKNVFVGMKGAVWKYLPELHSMLANGQLELYNKNLEFAADGQKNCALAALQRLRDVSLHPDLLSEGTLDVAGSRHHLKSLMRKSGKIESLLSVLDNIQKRDEKCIIFVVNKTLQSFLSQILAKQYSLPPVAIINGDTKVVNKRDQSLTRLGMINEFESKIGFNILIMSPIAAGVGLTVVGANNVIHLERHWNPAKEAQATDRVYRIGQKRDVNVYLPLIHHPKLDSYDVSLHRLLANKSLLKDAVVTSEQVLPLPAGLKAIKLLPSSRLCFKDLRSLQWEEFEALCAELLVREYVPENCWLTQEGSDFGADIVLTTPQGVTLVQCKHTRKPAYQGHKALIEVYSAKVKYENQLGKNVDSLIFVTNAVKLGNKTHSIAKEYAVDILYGKALSEYLGRHEVLYMDVVRRLEQSRLAA